MRLIYLEYVIIQLFFITADTIQNKIVYRLFSLMSTILLIGARACIYGFLLLFNRTIKTKELAIYRRYSITFPIRNDIEIE